MNTIDNKNKDFNTLADLVRIWGRKRGINNPDKQAMKVVEETSEIVREIVRGRYNSDELKDGIGDSLVTIIVLCDILKIDPLECLSMAYGVIKERDGELIDGTFVKSEDL